MREKKLQEALDAGDVQPEDYIGALEVEDIWDSIKHRINSSARLELEKRTVKDIRDFDYEVRFMGMRGGALHTEEAFAKFADIINDTCRTFKIVGSLSKALCIPLAGDLIGTAFYVSYIAFTPEAAKTIDKLIKLDKSSRFFVEGEMPKSEKDVKDE